MPMYDRKCSRCGAVEKDKLEPITYPTYECAEDGCPGEMERVWLQGSANGVVDDSIPGGLEIKNALCHPDGTPRRFDSHSDIRREAQRLGWTNYVEHRGQNGTDKSKFTSRWTSAPLMGKQEEERVAAWHAHERQLQAAGPTVQLSLVRWEDKSAPISSPSC